MLKNNSPRRNERRFESAIESLETRILFNQGASAQLNLISTVGSGPTAVYTYDVTLKNTGTTALGTFWMSWIPGEDFLPTTPLTESSPTGWGPPAVIGSGDSSDGASIQWVANSSSDHLAAGQSLSGFGFTTHDSPTELAAASVAHPPLASLTSFVYGGAPFSDGGFQFVVTPAQVVTQVATSTTLVAANANATTTFNPGDTINLTATVTPQAGGVPTGNVTFLENGNSIGTASLQNDGTAFLAVPSVAEGNYSFSAEYAGDTQHIASVSSAVPVTVGTPAVLPASTTTLAVSSDTIHVGDPATFTATVVSGDQGIEPEGSVSFFDGTTLLSTQSVENDGTAVFATLSLTAGTHSITASYSGSTNAASTSAASVVTVSPAAVTTPTIAKSTVPISIVGGQPAKGVITVSVADATGAGVKQAVRVGVFASSTGVFDSSAQLIGTQSKKLNLKTGKSAAVAVKIKSGLSALTAGTYTLFTRTTDASSNATDSAAGPTVMVAAPVIALSEVFAKLTFPATLTSGAKVRASAALQITNSGNILSAGATQITLFASTDGTLATGIQIASITKTLHIKPGKPLTVSVPVHQLPTLSASSYFIVAQVVDPKQGTSSVASGTTVSVG